MRTNEHAPTCSPRVVDLESSQRFVSPGALAHNKFLVVTDQNSKPASVWTGSTNRTATGLCTQLNNGLLIKNPGVARVYLDQWMALRAAGSTHPGALAASNAQPVTVTTGLGKSRSVTVQFTRAQGCVDLTELHDLVVGPQAGVLFLMFMPGNSGVLADLKALAAAKPDLLVRGVVGQLPNGRADETTGASTAVRVSMVGMPGTVTSFTFDAVQPQGMAHPAAGWALETTRKQFLGSIGYAIIHSKVLVIDPFTPQPTVVTGSHHFSISASTKNDENYVVIRGDRALAEAHAVNIDSAWRHSAGRARRADPRLRSVKFLESLVAEQRPTERFWHL